MDDGSHEVSQERLRTLVGRSRDELRDAAADFESVLASLDDLERSLEGDGDERAVRAARDAFLRFPRLQPMRGRKPSDQLEATRELVEILNHLVLLKRSS